MASSDSQIAKPQRGRPKRAELPNVNINTGAQSITTERASLEVYKVLYCTMNCHNKFAKLRPILNKCVNRDHIQLDRATPTMQDIRTIDSNATQFI